MSVNRILFFCAECVQKAEGLGFLALETRGRDALELGL